MIFMTQGRAFIEDCLASIEKWDGNRENKMFISQQIYEGLKMSVNSIIEAGQFLLQHQMSIFKHFDQKILSRHT